MGETARSAAIAWSKSVEKILRTAQAIDLLRNPSGITSEALLAAVLGCAKLEDPNHSPTWLRRRLGFLDSQAPSEVSAALGIPYAAPGAAGLLMSFSDDGRAVLQLAEAAAARSGGKMYARQVVGGLLFAERGGGTIGAQRLIERSRAGDAPQLRLDFIEYINRGPFAEEEKTFWREQIQPPRATPSRSVLVIASQFDRPNLAEMISDGSIRVLTLEDLGDKDTIDHSIFRAADEVDFVLVGCYPHLFRFDYLRLERTGKVIPVVVAGGTPDDVPPELRHLRIEDARTPAGIAALKERIAAGAHRSFEVRRFTLSDLATESDALGFTPHVEALAEFLSSPDTRPPLTVSIEGEWGSGKSSFLRQLAKSLGRGPHPRRVIWFNAWRYDKDESLWAAFAEQFFENAPDGNLAQRLVAQLRLVWGRIEGRRLWRAVGKFAGFAAAFGVAMWTIWHVAGKVAPNSKPPEWIAWVIPLALAAYKSDLAQRALALFKPFDLRLNELISEVDYESKRTFLSRFREDFKLAQQALVRDDRIFVFVDDLDRCEVPRAAELLQAINLMLTDDDKSEPSKLVTVLGIDREKVAAALAIRSEKLLPLLAPPAEGSKAAYDAQKALAFGHSFLEKFIQLPFRLPRPRSTGIAPFLDRVLSRSEPATAPTPPADAPQIAPPQALAAPEVPLPAAKARKLAQEAGKLLRDAPELRAVLEAVAPALDFNPRRIIQFVNVFRLRVYLAGAHGLFAPAAGRRALSLLQLGKVTALSLRWPQLAEALLREPRALAALELQALEQSEKSPLGDNLQREPRLRELLRNGLAAHAKPLPLDQAKLAADLASLAEVDLAAVLDAWSPAG